MLTEKIMHECIKKLLADVAAPKQEDLECLSKLMSTVGRQLDANPNAKMYMDAYFERINTLCKNQTLESRIRFMLQASVSSLCLQAHIWLLCVHEPAVHWSHPGMQDTLLSCSGPPFSVSGLYADFRSCAMVYATVGATMEHHCDTKRQGT